MGARREVVVTAEAFDESLVFLDLEMSLEEITSPGRCVGCGETMKKDYLQYAFGREPRYIFARVAGYSCDTCDHTAISPEASAKAHQQVLLEHELAGRQEDRYSRNLRRIIKAEDTIRLRQAAHR